MFCQNCGAQNPDGAPFCSTCGQALNNAQAPAQPPVQPPVQQPVYGAPVQPPVQQPPVYAAPQQPSVPGKGLSIASMITGIASLVMLCVLYLSVPAAIVGLVLGIISSNKAKEVGMKNGMATAGIICSSIALGISILIIFLAVIGIATL